MSNACGLKSTYVRDAYFPSDRRVKVIAICVNGTTMKSALTRQIWEIPFSTGSMTTTASDKKFRFPK